MNKKGFMPEKLEISNGFNNDYMTTAGFRASTRNL